MKLVLPAPAKLNLFLHVVGQRPDGYHDLQTLFQLIDYSDILTFELIQTPHIKLISTLDLPLEQDLIWKAAQILRQKTRISSGIEIEVVKKIPVGGGLGGGSSNAATTLLALNHLWKTKLSIDELAELGQTLGADVPVFIRGLTSWGEGTGNLLTPVTLPEKWYLVLTPPCNVLTSKIFTHSELTRDTSQITIHDFLTGKGHNDLEAVAKKCYPEIAIALESLSKLSKAYMTGSGASVFASFPTQQTALDALQKLPSSFKSFIAKGIHQSPLHLLLDQVSSNE